MTHTQIPKHRASLKYSVTKTEKFDYVKEKQGLTIYRGFLFNITAQSLEHAETVADNWRDFLIGYGLTCEDCPDCNEVGEHGTPANYADYIPMTDEFDTVKDFQSYVKEVWREWKQELN